uniref:Acyltransf_C domain-containing protein n=1 Tax=Heterorhabditis bacteriophora TaxID=37862 RepID=A0A1I7WSU5_HETBA
MFGEWPHSESNRVCIHYDIIKVNPEWADEEKLKNFLYNRYEIKDKLLDAFYRTGSFPGEARPVIVPQSTMLISQVRNLKDVEPGILTGKSKVHMI